MEALFALLVSISVEVSLIALCLFVIFLCIFLYFVPTYVAWKRKHPYLIAIFAINFLFGFVMIGWIGALIWAVWQKPDPVSINVNVNQK